MFQFLQQQMDRLLPESTQGDYRQIRRGRLIIGLCWSLTVLVLLAMATNAAAGDVLLVLVAGTLAVVMIGVPLSLRRLGLGPPAHLFVTASAAAIGWAVINGGGLQSGSMLYIPSFSILAFVLLGPRSGGLWAILILVFCLGLGLGEEHLPEAVEQTADLTTRWMIRAIISVFTAAALVLYTEHTNTLAQDALTEARERADAANAAKSLFLATMSHELRTPMNGVLGLTEVLLSEAHTARQETLLRNIDTSGRTLVGLLNDLLDFSKVEAGELCLEVVPYQPAGAIRAALEPLEAVAARQGLAVRAHLDGLAPWVRGDPSRLRQVLVNLLGNAIKFTDSGTINVTAQQQADWLSVRVTDTGIGIPAARLPRLFDPFTQADASITRRYGGTGLGLAICRQLIEQMGGEIGVESQEGVGSTFWFQIPAPATAAPTLSLVQGKEPVRTHAGRLLLAEDHPINQLVAVNMLEQLGYTVSVVSDGTAAVAAVLESPPDVVLMDYHMPKMDGITATRELRAAGVEVPIIALTASTLPEDRAACEAAGMDGFLSKPVTVSALEAALATALAPEAAVGS